MRSFVHRNLSICVRNSANNVMRLLANALLLTKPVTYTCGSFWRNLGDNDREDKSTA